MRSVRPTTGWEGMTAEQVLRCASLKQNRQLSYEELAFHLEDSDFFRLEMGSIPASRSSRRTSRSCGKRSRKTARGWKSGSDRTLVTDEVISRLKKGKAVKARVSLEQQGNAFKIMKVEVLN